MLLTRSLCHAFPLNFVAVGSRSLCYYIVLSPPGRDCEIEHSELQQGKAMGRGKTRRKCPGEGGEGNGEESGAD